MTTPPSLVDILNNVLSAITTILSSVASAIAENASVIATIVVVGALVYMVMRFGSRIFSGVTAWVRGLF